ncbi:MAG: efflux RND transporter periplasmic adaptor subunit [Acidobacteriota bacterium]|jgi:RND family efflux transporter MFP subunit
MTDERPSLDALRIDREPDEPTASSGRWPLWTVCALIVAAAGALGFFWWQDSAAPPAVATAAVQEVGGGSPAVLDASGYVVARRQATVSSKVTGKIVEVLVEEGLVVEEGQVLARLDDSTVRASLALAEANLEAARRSLTETEVRLAKAELDRGRAASLVGQEVSAQETLDAARAEVDALRARLELAREQVTVAERQVALQRVALADMVIRAPFDGVAVSKNAQPGEMISPVSAGGGFTRTGICTVVDMGSLEIEVDVGESYIQRVRPDQRVEATLDAYPDWRIPARVITIVPAADREKATVRVRIGFDGLDPRILPDMGVKVSFLSEVEAGGRSETRLLVPRAAVALASGPDDGDAAVWVVVSGSAAEGNRTRLERRAVTTGAVEGDRVQVLSGLAAGERVVVDGPPGLTGGMNVVDETTNRR